MPTVTVGSSWTRPDNYFSQPDGAYPVTLVGIGATDDDGTFVPGATYEHTGMYGLKVKNSWRFQLDNGEIIEAGVTVPREGRIAQNSTFFAYASALAGNKPAAGVSFDSDSLIGLRALAFIQRDDNDTPRISSLAALREQAAPAPAPAPAPAAAPAPEPAPAAQPLREQVAAGEAPSKLPF